jgi:ribonuclease T1
VTGFGSDACTWDVRGRLQTVTRPGYSGSFTYDPNNQRAAQTVNGVSTTFLLDGSRCVSEITGSTTVPVLFGAGGQAINRNGRWLTPDSRGSTSRVTDGTGNVVQTYGYGVFGQVVPSTPEANPIQFLGGMNDNNGLHYLGGSRYFSPQVGQPINGSLAMVADMLPALSPMQNFAMGASNCHLEAPDWLLNGIAQGAKVGFWAGGALGLLAGGTAGTTLGAGGTLVGAAVGAAKGAAIGAAVGTAVGGAIGAGVSAIIHAINSTCTYAVSSGGSGSGPTDPVVPDLAPGTLPAEEQSAVDETVSHIRNGDPAPPYARSSKWGTPFKNNEGRLPFTGGQTYSEYDIRPPTGTSGIGPRRVVVGSDGIFYYTADHYSSFWKL